MVSRFATAVFGCMGVALAAGCAAERHESIPNSAMLVDKSNGNVNFTSPHDGDVYVYDRSSGKMLYSGRMERNQTLAVNARDDRITLNGRTVMDQQIRDNDELKVYFREDASAAQTAGSRVVVEPRNGGRNVTVQSRDDTDTAVTVHPHGSDSSVTVHPGDDGDQKVIVEPGRH